jgi:hypothetical protein
MPGKRLKHILSAQWNERLTALRLHPVAGSGIRKVAFGDLHHHELATLTEFGCFDFWHGG